MSSHREINVTCPQCHKENSCVIWSSINTALDPEMKKAVRDRSAFQFICPDCGAKTNLVYGFLYHQMEDHIMIQYAASDEAAEEAYKMFTGDDPSGMIKNLLSSNYLIRIVRTQNELLEKLAIFDAGLDDRIIEILKIFTLASFQQQNPDEKPTEILFFSDQGKKIFQVIAGEKTCGAAEIPEDFYEKVRQMYQDKIPDIRADDPFIDRTWALEKLGLE